MDLSVYLEPANISDNFTNDHFAEKRLGNKVNIFREKEHFPSIEDLDIAIIGVKEDRNSLNNAACCEAPDPIR